MTDHVHINLTPTTQGKLDELALVTGRSADDLAEDALVGYLDEVVKNDRPTVIDWDVALARLREKTLVRRPERPE